MHDVEQRIEFFRHDVGKDELGAIASTLDSLVLTTGNQTRSMEQKLGDYLGVKHVIGVDSCTAALHLSLLASGIKEGDEVVVPAMTFIASANAVLMAGGTPRFADVDPQTGNLTVETITSAVTSKTRAIMPVHLYGQMCDMKAIKHFADTHGLAVIEDSAHCLEVKHDGVQPGSHSAAACFSFYPTKAMTCGEGGALATNDSDLAARARQLALHGMTSSAYDRYGKRYRHWDMTVMGWKYNLDNIRASMLIPQIDKLDDRWNRRRKICERYESQLRDVPGISFPAVEVEAATARHLFTVWVSPDIRDAVLQELQARNIGVAVNYRPVHLMTYYRENFGHQEGTFPVAERMGAGTLTLPCYPGLRDDEVDRVAQSLIAIVESLQQSGQVVSGSVATTDVRGSCSAESLPQELPHSNDMRVTNQY
ncbi:MAG: DegT/DnrJ/EryC1/StrS family aminotransferase [Phycisphaerae bacterium]